MRLKLIVAMVSDEKTATVIDAARAGGATGATTITSVRGEGLEPEKTIFGLDLAAKRDIVLFLVIEPRARDILERIRDAGAFDSEPGTPASQSAACPSTRSRNVTIPTGLRW